jgi:hypothetical protein
MVRILFLRDNAPTRFARFSDWHTPNQKTTEININKLIFFLQDTLAQGLLGCGHPICQITIQDGIQIHLMKGGKQMKSVVRKAALVITTLWLTTQTALAAGGGGAPIVIVADSRKLTGIMAWWANLYNESHVYFTILTIILIPLVGVIFGVLADFIMHFIGIDLKSRDLAEH